jgi:hypothetical protein
MTNILENCPRTTYLAFEFPNEETTLAFLQKCLDEHPSVEVTLADQCTIFIPRDMLAVLSALFDAIPPNQVHPVYPRSRWASKRHEEQHELCGRKERLQIIE